jgi:hypothetical protein
MARVSSRQREEAMIRIVTSITLASGGLAAAASFAMGVAAADPDASTVSVPDPFGVTFVGPTDFSYQTSDATEGVAYGQQTLNFDSSSFAPSVDQFFINNVTVDGQPLNLSTNPLTDNGLQGIVIDKVMSTGDEQQVLLPAIAGTNIQSAVIDIHDWGNGYGYEIIDLVGPGPTHLNSDGVHNAIGAWLVTPQGDYDVSQWEDGGDYGNLAYMENVLYDISNPLSDPFGVTFVGNPDITYQTGDIFQNNAYSDQTVDFDSSSLAPFVQNFFTNNVTVDGQPLNLSSNPLTDADLETHVIDKVEFGGLFDGLAEQQILLPSIAGTNIDHGVIDIDNFGNGYSLDYIDLVGPGTTSTGGVDNAIGAWLVTPMGTFDVSQFAMPEAQMFDPSNFDPSAFFPDAALTTPAFDFLF